jgi:hypothetical protein
MTNRIQIKPVYGIHYKPGSVIFTRKDGAFLSEGIVWFLDQFDAADFLASHVLIVENERFGIESAEEGIKYTRLWPLFNDPAYSIVVRDPVGLDIDMGIRIMNTALKYYGQPYDYLALVSGFPVQVVAKLWKLVPFLRKLPIPFHLPGAFVCSAYVSQVLKDQDEFKDAKLFQDWHVTRITPSMLYREENLWKPFRFELGEYEKSRFLDKVFNERGEEVE